MRRTLAEPDAPAAEPASGDQSLANLLEQITRTLDEEGAVDVEELARAYPQYADRLRELMPTMRAMAHWGRAPASGLSDGAHGPSTSPMTGVLGDFRIVRELGRGGMGTVFEAEQITMGRRVALKVLPFAALAHDKALQRFRNEVRAAAALDHPHIVSVYSVGEERGIHYYSMQLVRGQTLADLILQGRNQRGAPTPGAAHNVVVDAPANSLGNENPTVDSATISPPSTKRDEQARISIAVDSRPAAERYRAAARLGIQAAEALQHAHDQGVLHRDIKPGNLMLDADGELYVTDFGLARIQTDAGMTMTGDLVGTLRYMAPEQALAKRVAIDHRADVYSLGATLYELLTLEPAFGESDRSELLKQIAFTEPTPLRKLDRHIPAELETIVLKAMGKNPDERYQSAQQLSEDLRAFLENRPIKAKSPTLLSRAAKWSRRNVAVVWTTAGAAIFVSLAMVGALVLTTREAHRASEAERRAEAALATAEGRLKIARQAVDQMYTEVAEKWLGQEKELAPLQREFLRKALALYEQLAQEQTGDLEYQLDAADARGRVASIYASLGEFTRAEQAWRATISHRERLMARFGKSVEVQRKLSYALRNLAQELDSVSRSEEALPLLERALAINEAIMPADGNMGRSNVAGTHHSLGNLYLGLRRLDDAEDAYQRSADLFDALCMEEPNDAEYRSSLAISLHDLGRSYWAQNRRDEAEQSYARAIKLLEELLVADPQNVGYQQSLVIQLLNWGGTDKCTRAAAILRPLVDKFPDQPKYKHWLIGSQFNLGVGLYNEGKTQEAEETSISIVAMAEQLVADYPQHPDFQFQLCTLWNLLASALEFNGRPRDGEPYRVRAHDGLAQLVAAYPLQASYKLALAESISGGVGFALSSTDPSRDLTSVLKDARRAVEIAPWSGSSWCLLSAAEYRNGHWEEAVEAAQKSLEFNSGDEVTAGHLTIALARAQQGMMKEAQESYAKAKPGIASGLPSTILPIWLLDEAKKVFGDETIADIAPASELTDAPEASLRGAIGNWVEVPRRDPRFGQAHEVGDDYAVLGKYADAAREYLHAVEQYPNDSAIAVRAAILELASGDRDGYEAMCQKMLDKYRVTDNLVAARQTCWACAISPQPVGDIDELLRLAELALEDTQAPQLAARERGLVAYRAGDWEGALKWCAESRELESRANNKVSKPISWLIEAMALHQLGKAAEAKSSFDEAVNMAPESIPGRDWIEWVYYQQLRCEAEELLQAKEE